MPTDGAESGTEGGQELGVPTIGDGDGGGEIGVGGYICFPLPQHSHTVHCYQTHYGSVSGGRVSPWGTGVPDVVITSDRRRPGIG